MLRHFYLIIFLLNARENVYNNKKMEDTIDDHGIWIFNIIFM